MKAECRHGARIGDICRACDKQAEDRKEARADRGRDYPKDLDWNLPVDWRE